MSFARKYNIKSEHYETVANYSMILFDMLIKIHKYGEYERFLLNSGALLHDVGYYISDLSHHKNSLKMIMEFPDLNIDIKEKTLIGLIARYHRKSFPKDSDDYYSTLINKDKILINKLASILRIADSLDYSHLSIVKSFDCQIKEEEVELNIITKFDAEKECKKTQKKSGLFEQNFNKKVVINYKIL